MLNGPALPYKEEDAGSIGHRPLRKSGTLQVKRSGERRIWFSTLVASAATVQQRGLGLSQGKGETMTPELHPNAAKNFVEKVLVPLAAVAPESPQEPSEPPTDMFSPGGHVVATFGEED